MSDRDEAKRLRDRDAIRADEAKRLVLAPTFGAPCLVARTKVIQSYPIVAAAYYGCESQTVIGTEVEGGPATITTDGDTFYALNLGSVVPAQGTPIVTTFIGNRWVFRYDG
jgi:hypothetical protein